MRFRRRLFGYDEKQASKYLSLLESEGHLLEAKLLHQSEENSFRNGNMTAHLAALQSELKALTLEADRLKRRLDLKKDGPPT